MNFKFNFNEMAQKYKQRLSSQSNEPMFIPAFIERQRLDIEKLEAEKRHLQSWIY